MIHFTCPCGNTLFFDNSLCLQCRRPVGYDITTNQFRIVEPGGKLRACENGVRYGNCNWLVPAGSPNSLCRSCQLTRTIPNLTTVGQSDAWGRMEAEKRRVIYSIARLGLFPLSKAESPLAGLAFDFLAPEPGQQVLTGHEDGTITVNLLEADDAYREGARRQMREPYRTLIGHFRHEIGHYYWDRFFLQRPDSDPALAAYRALFGDERQDYATALRNYYEQGPSANWSEQFITAYASAHPWEDWAETWAQYLHIVDGIETSRAFGWTGEAIALPFTPFTAADLVSKGVGADNQFLNTLNSWLKISPALNEIATSLGYRNLYPFALNPATARKVLFVHTSIQAAAGLEAERPAA